MILRLGRHNKQLVYVQPDDEPSDTDRLFAVFFRPEDAAMVVKWCTFLTPPAQNEELAEEKSA